MERVKLHAMHRDVRERHGKSKEIATLTEPTVCRATREISISELCTRYRDICNNADRERERERERERGGGGERERRRGKKETEMQLSASLSLETILE
jgi:hypothetical protein